MWVGCRRSFRVGCTAILLLLMSPFALAERGTVIAKPLRILVAETNYGGCMVRLSVSPQSVLPNCAPNWVSMSCDGTYLSKDLALRLLEQTQMAFALDRELAVHIDDARRHNGYCLAYRIDLY